MHVSQVGFIYLPAYFHVSSSSSYVSSYAFSYSHSYLHSYLHSHAHLYVCQVADSHAPGSALNEEQQAHFEGFTYVPRADPLGEWSVREGACVRVSDLFVAVWSRISRSRAEFHTNYVPFLTDGPRYHTTAYLTVCGRQTTLITMTTNTLLIWLVSTMSKFPCTPFKMAWSDALTVLIISEYMYPMTPPQAAKTANENNHVQ